MVPDRQERRVPDHGPGRGRTRDGRDGNALPAASSTRWTARLRGKAGDDADPAPYRLPHHDCLDTPGNL